MEPNDTQPGGSSGRTITIQLTRDTIVLIAALLFLGVAILLAVIFPSASSSTPTPTSIASAQTTTPVSAGTAAASASTPAPSVAPVGSTANAVPATPAEGYPAPDSGAATSAAVGGAPTGEPATPASFSEQQLTPTAPAPQGSGANTQPTDIPAFSPNRSTQSAAPSNATTSAYPAPGTSSSAPTAVTGQATAAQSPGQSTPDPNEEPLFQDTPAANPAPQTQPTARIQPTPQLQPTPEPQPTPLPRPAATPRPRPTAAPTAIPVDVLRGTVRWTAARSPIVLTRDQQLAPGATLLIEPGVEVRLAPGVSFFVEGTLYAIGAPDRPIRFVGSTPQRWEGLFGRAGSNIALEYTEIHGGGAGGTVLTSEGGNLVLHHAQINDNGGHVQVNDSRLEVRDSEIAGNDMPYGSAIEASYSGGGFVIMTNNRIGGNRMQAGTSPVRISNLSGIDTVNLDLQGNLLVGQEGPDLELSTNGPLQGGLSCNALIGGTNGLSVRSETPQVPGFGLTIRNNATEAHTPPIIPEYLRYGIGRGATSEIALDMSGNWWGNPLGPYNPSRHVDGRGEAVGDNIEFGSWLTERPACAPKQ